MAVTRDMAEPRPSPKRAGAGQRVDRLIVLRLAAAFLFGFVMVLLVASLARAQSPNRAGVVVQFSDGHTESACVAFGESQITGLELLSRAGYTANAEINALGAAVCSVNNDGCAFPGENCFCKCQDPSGTNCSYWRYFHLASGTWQFASKGAGTFMVGNGQLDGWRFSTGTQNNAAGPPTMTFDQVCPAPTATPPPATSTPTRAPTPIPPSATPAPTVATPTAIPAALPTLPPTPTARPFSPAPTRAAVSVPPTRTPTAPPPPPTPQAVAAAPVSATSPPTATATDPPPTPMQIVISAPTPQPDAGPGAADAAGYILAGVALLGLSGAMLLRVVKPR